MTNKGWNMDKILGKTTTVCLIITMIVCMVFGVAATAFGINANREYDVLYEEYRSLEKAMDAHIKDSERLERELDNYVRLKVSEEYFTELLYNSKENVRIGETSELNELIDKLLGFVVVD